MIRNDSARPQDVKVSLFFPHGGSAGDATYQNMPSGKIWIYNPANSNFLGSAIVNGSEDVSLAVRTLNISQSLAYDGMPQSSALGFQANNYLFLPVYFNNFNSWNSMIYITNVGSGSTTAQVRYYNNAGSQTGAVNIPLAANASVVLAPTSSATTGGVRITSDPAQAQPLAASITHRLDSLGQTSGHAAINVGAEDLYLPSLCKSYSGWECGINLFNTENEGTGACIIEFYDQAGIRVGTLPCSLSGYGSAMFMPSQFPVGPNWLGSARVHADNKLVASVLQQQSANNDWQAYRGFKSGVPSLYVPWVQMSEGWTSNLAVMNVGCSATTITVSFYDANGSPAGNQSSIVNQYASYQICGGIPASARSAFISTSPSCNVVATMNSITGSVSDGGVIYSVTD